VEPVAGEVGTPDGARLWTSQWTPDRATRATLVLVHGLGEHCGRHAHVARRLAAADFAVLAFDLRGHGRSSGRRGDTRMEQALDDVERLLAVAAGLHPGVPSFLYGHSLGALIVLTAIVRRRPALRGAVVSAPPLRNALQRQKAKLLLAGVLGRVVPSLSLPTRLDASALSRDPAVVAAYRADPLVHDRASHGFARDALAAPREVASAGTLAAPVLVVHGDADRIALVEGSRALAARHPGLVTLREQAGFFHEPHNDPGGARVLDEVVAWLDGRRAAGTE
jgi:alpha-beta hydrolase superfamily lysophospholipase